MALREEAPTVILKPSLLIAVAKPHVMARSASHGKKVCLSEPARAVA